MLYTDYSNQLPREYQLRPLITDYIGLNVIITSLLEMRPLPANIIIKKDYIMRGSISAHVYLKVDIIRSNWVRDYRIEIYAIESTPCGRPVYKVMNTAQYLNRHISKGDCLRDLDINGYQGKTSQLCSIWSVTRRYHK